MWMPKICRLCGQISENVRPIFDNCNAKTFFDLKLKKCLSISITEQDAKPKEVCLNCYKTVEDYYNFITICEGTDFEYDRILFENASKWMQKEPDIFLEKPVPVIQKETTFEAFTDIRKPVEKDINECYSHVVPVVDPILEPSDPCQPSIQKTADCKLKPFSCSICQKRFMRRANVQVHISMQHSTVRPFQCEQCDLAFSTKRELRIHFALHTGKYRCEYCGRVFTTRYKLVRHTRTHTGERPFVCETCNKGFSDKRNLDAHVLAVHKNQKPYVCSQCQKGFDSKSHLTEHSRVHSSESAFVCDLCGQKFKWRPNLVLHLRWHSGELYKCTVCDQKFSRPTKLNKHMSSRHPDCSK